MTRRSRFEIAIMVPAIFYIYDAASGFRDAGDYWPSVFEARRRLRMNTNPNTICVNIENKNPCLLTNWPLTIWHDGLPYAVHIDLPAESTITHCFEPYDGKQWTCHECGSLLRYDRSTFVDELGDASVVPASVFICENPACRMYYDVAWNGTSHEPVYLIEQEGA